MGDFLAMGVGRLHLSLADFWSLTLAQFLRIVEQYFEERKSHDLLCGHLIAQIRTIAANWGRDEKEQPVIYQPKDFLTFKYLDKSTGKIAEGYKQADGTWVSEEEFIASQERVRKLAGVD